MQSPALRPNRSLPKVFHRFLNLLAHKRCERFRVGLRDMVVVPVHEDIADDWFTDIAFTELISQVGIIDVTEIKLIDLFREVFQVISR